MYESCKNQKLSTYISAHLNEMETAKYALNSPSFHTVKISEDTYFEISVNVELNTIATSLNPVSKVENRCFELVLNPHDFSLIKIN